MTRRTRTAVLAGAAAVAAAGLAIGGSVALADDGTDSVPVRLVVHEDGNDRDCPDGGGGPAPSDATDASAL